MENQSLGECALNDGEVQNVSTGAEFYCVHLCMGMKKQLKKSNTSRTIDSTEFLCDFQMFILLKLKGILYFPKLPDDDPTTRSSETLDHELDSEQLKADATCRVVCLGFRTTAHGDKAEPDIKITR